MTSVPHMSRLASRQLNTRFGTWTEHLYYDGRAESIALVYGDVSGRSDVLCRVHSACLSAHVFNSVECDCREQMDLAQSAIAAGGAGVVIWLDQDGRGNGHLALMLVARMAAERHISQTEAYEILGYPKDHRSYAVAAAILADLTVESVVLLTDNPRKASELAERGITVTASRSVAVDLVSHPQLLGYYADRQARGYTLPVPANPPGTSAGAPR